MGLECEKWILFRAFGRNTMQTPYIHFNSIYVKKRCSMIIFRVLDENPTHKHMLWRQMTEVGNLTSWPQMTLTSEKVTLGKGRCLDMSQTRIMSIHRLLMRLFSAFCGGKQNGNLKHVVFDLTCDVTGDPRVQFFNSIWNISSSALHCRLNFSATSIGYRDT